MKPGIVACASRRMRNSNHPWIHKKLKTRLGFVRSCPKKEGGEEEEEERMGRGEKRREGEEKDKNRSHKKPKVCLYRNILIPLDNVDSLQINPHKRLSLIADDSFSVDK